MCDTVWQRGRVSCSLLVLVSPRCLLSFPAISQPAAHRCFMLLNNTATHLLLQPSLYKSYNHYILSSWVPTATWRSCGRRSRATSCASCSASDAGSTGECVSLASSSGSRQQLQSSSSRRRTRAPSSVHPLGPPHGRTPCNISAATTICSQMRVSVKR